MDSSLTFPLPSLLACSHQLAAPPIPPSSAETGFLDDVGFHSTALGPGYDRPFQFDPSVREPKSIQLYRHLNLKSCVWTFDAYYDMTELIDVCGGSVTADFQVGPPGSCAWVPCQLCCRNTSCVPPQVAFQAGLAR